MSLIRLSVFLPCTLILCACAPLQDLMRQAASPSVESGTETPTEDELVEIARNMPTEKDIQERFLALPGMYRQICLAPELAPYFDKTPCLPSMATKAHVSDTTRITPIQAAAMRQAVSEIRELNDETRRLMIESGLEPYASHAREAALTYDPLVVTNQNALINGDITWGEYNRRRLELGNRPNPFASDNKANDYRTAPSSVSVTPEH